MTTQIRLPAVVAAGLVALLLAVPRGTGADDKKEARVNIMRHLLKVLAPKDVAKSVRRWNR